jgi:hypothetical protein
LLGLTLLYIKSTTIHPLYFWVIKTIFWRRCWYVSNVSIIFDAPCLFYTICFMFCLHFVAFLCDFRN